MSFPAYADYKESGVPWLGVVPSHWEIGRVKDLFVIQKRIAGELGHDVLSITQSGIKVKDIDSNDGQVSMDYSKYQLVYPGDFAMNHMDLLTGWIDIATVRGVTSPDYRVFSARSDREIVPDYYLYAFQMAYSQRQFYPFGQGSSQLGRWRLPTDAFYAFSILRPPVAEQEVIAAFLDRETAKIDALVAEQERLITLLKEKRQAVISQAVTKGLNPNAPLRDSGIEWLGEIPANWTVAPLKRLISPATSGPRGWSDLAAEEGSFFFQSQNIGRNMEADFSDGKRIEAPEGPDADRARLQSDDVVVCITGGRTGAVAHISDLPEEVYINQHVCLLRPSSAETSGLYLAYGLFGLPGQEQLALAMYGLKQGLSLENVREVVLPLPPKAERQMIAAHLDQQTARFEALVTEAQSAISLLRERRAALISAAVTGKIDVRGAVAVDPALEVA